MRCLEGRIPIPGVEARRQVVTKALAHGAHLAASPTGILIVLYGMAELMGDDVSIFAVIHTPITKVDGIVARGIE